MITCAAALALSTHIGMTTDFNEVHPSLQCQSGQIIAGAYYNSESAISFYAGGVIESGRWALEAGLVTGYSGADVIPYGRVTYRFAPNLYGFVAPAYAEGEWGVVLGPEIRF